MIDDENIEHPGEEENYFVSMTDMMVGLVFIFIIILMYFVLQFRDQVEKNASSDRTRTEILKEIRDKLKEKQIPSTEDIADGVIRLPDGVLFDSGEDKISNIGEEKLTILSEVLWEVLPCYSDYEISIEKPKCKNNISHKIESFYIEGHTDSDPMRPNERIKDNLDLSAFRATNTYRKITKSEPRLEKLCAHKGGHCYPILSVSGYGDHRLVYAGTNVNLKGQNRRIDLRIIMLKPDAGEAARAVSKAVAAN